MQAFAAVLFILYYFGEEVIFVGVLLCEESKTYCMLFTFRVLALLEHDFAGFNVFRLIDCQKSDAIVFFSREQGKAVERFKRFGFAFIFKADANGFTVVEIYTFHIIEVRS